MRSGLKKVFFLISRRIKLLVLWIKSKFTSPGFPSPKPMGVVKKIRFETKERVEFPKMDGFNSRTLCRSERGCA